MAFLSEITDYKNTILERMISDQGICKALTYQNTDFLDQPDVDEPAVLIYSNIFPHRFIPDTVTTTGTYITLSLGNFELINSSFKAGIIVISVFTHRDTFKTDYGCTRTDYIVNRIDEILNYKTGVGIGKLEFDSLKEYVVNEKFQGYLVSYRPVDFNR